MNIIVAISTSTIICNQRRVVNRPVNATAVFDNPLDRTNLKIASVHTLAAVCTQHPLAL
jgi:hypothetical protein